MLCQYWRTCLPVCQPSLTCNIGCITPLAFSLGCVWGNNLSITPFASRFFIKGKKTPDRTKHSHCQCAVLVRIEVQSAFEIHTTFTRHVTVMSHVSSKVLLLSDTCCSFLICLVVHAVMHKIRSRWPNEELGRTLNVEVLLLERNSKEWGRRRFNKLTVAHSSVSHEPSQVRIKNVLNFAPSPKIYTFDICISKQSHCCTNAKTVVVSPQFPFPASSDFRKGGWDCRVGVAVYKIWQKHLFCPFWGLIC